MAYKSIVFIPKATSFNVKKNKNSFTKTQKESKVLQIKPDDWSK